MTATLVRSNLVFLAVLIIALAIVAALVGAGLQGSGQTAGATSHTPVVQVTPEEAHWYNRPTLVETASRDLVTVYEGHIVDDEAGLWSKTSSDGGNAWSEPVFIEYAHHPNLAVSTGASSTGGKTWLVYARPESHWNIFYRTSDAGGAS